MAWVEQGMDVVAPVLGHAPFTGNRPNIAWPPESFIRLLDQLS